MPKPAPSRAIRLRGVRQNNLKGFDLDLPLHRLIVITGLSGSGKSSLAFDTLYAEGQRRYIETFSPYARQFFDRMDKPAVDSIEGIPPAIAIEQRNAVRTTRSTVGTMTEICDYMKVLWPHVAQLHCRSCGQPVRKDSPQQVWEAVAKAECGTRNAELAAAQSNTTTAPAQSPIANRQSPGREILIDGMKAGGRATKLLRPPVICEHKPIVLLRLAERKSPATSIPRRELREARPLTGKSNWPWMSMRPI
jgi:excinuclease UvrABC ATPase subunit